MIKILTITFSISVSIADTIAITQPNLSGIALNIAYQGKIYHSGNMCAGATKGFDCI